MEELLVAYIIALSSAGHSIQASDYRHYDDNVKVAKANYYQVKEPRAYKAMASVR